jgi:hypothetical protein
MIKKNVKECNVVILITDRETNIKLWDNGSLSYNHNKKTTLPYQYVNLYITSDDDKQEGDWYIDDCFLIRKSITSDKDYWSVRNDYKKIIATTNPDLTIFKGAGINFPLPLIPLDFIKQYCESNGKIEKVFVEYEKITPGLDKDGFGIPTDETYDVLKIDEIDNSINIFTVKEKLFTRDEVIKITESARNHGQRQGDILWEEWINENIK